MRTVIFGNAYNKKEEQHENRKTGAVGTNTIHNEG